MTKPPLSILFKSPEETAAFAEYLARNLSAGDTILLTGDIGAGKTHFARHLIWALLGYHEDVPSPTFTLVQTYEGQFGEIWHADLYRLSSPEEVLELGLVDAFENQICLVEWPDRLEELAPANALQISLTMTDIPGHRQAQVHWLDEKWVEKVTGARI